MLRNNLERYGKFCYTEIYYDDVLCSNKKYKILPANPERNASSGTPFSRNPVKDTQPFFLTHIFLYITEKRCRMKEIDITVLIIS